LAEAYQPLYLKYRPQSLADLVGQSSVAQSLKNAIEHNRIAHAYLFTGPRGCGKTSSARILAKSINCDLGKTATPCLKCTSCDEVRIGNSPSVIEIDAASNNSVDDARLLIERAPLVAQNGKNKLYIIDECHMLTTGAFNALLKTIEEPPAHVIFILATTEEHKVPHTIMSRCQRLMFRLVNQTELVAHLKKIAQMENIEIEDDAIDLIARRSGGGLRDALGLLDQAGLVASPGKPATVKDLLTLLGAVHEDVLLQISQAVLEHDGKAALQAAHGLMMEGREPTQLALELAKHFLNLAKASYLATAKSAHADTHSLILGSASYIDGLIQQAPGFERAELAQIVEQLDKLEQSCKRSSQPALNLEVALVALCHRQDILLLQDLSARVSQLEAELRDGVSPPSSHQSRPATAPRTPAPTPAPRPAPLPQRPVEQPSPAARSQSAGGVTTNTARPSEIAKPATAQSPIRETTTQPSTPTANSQAPVAEAKSDSQPSPQNSPAHFPAVETQSAPQPSPPDALASPPTTESKPTIGPPESDDGDVDVEVDQEPQDADDELNEESPPAVPPSPQMTISTLTESEAEPEAESTAPDSVPASEKREAERVPTPAEPPADRGVDHVALEEFWSNLKDELHGRSVPLFSIVSEHAFPLALEKDNLTIGVMMSHFQGMIEARSEQLKAACEAVAGRPMSLKVKLVDRNASAAPRPRAKGKKTAATADDGSEESEGAGAVAVATPPPLKQPSRVENAEPKVSPVHEKLNAPEAANEKVNAVSSSPESELQERTAADSGLIAEAYKLFEGPGSRRILPS
jgi:DNA polymerase-3 subunit gamma/tau